MNFSAEPSKEFAYRLFDNILGFIFDASSCTTKLRFLRHGFIVGTKIDCTVKTIGTTGFEPATYCSQSNRATKLRYVPVEFNISH